jgi:hypothetical protein
MHALERTHPGLPVAPGNVERRACASLRHGTRSFLLNRDVVTGKTLAPAYGPTRTERAVVAHVHTVVATDPHAPRWHVVCDPLNTYLSESVVRWVAEISGVTENIGVKGECGMVASMATRAAFGRQSDHTVVFHSTPTQSSWLTQIKIWLRLLVRNVLTCGSFSL